MTISSQSHYYVPNQDVVSFVLDHPDYDLDEPLFIDSSDPSTFYTYRTATELIRKLIAGLHAEGLRPGDVVGIHSFNSITYPLVSLAVIGAGGIAVGTNPGWTQAELQHALRVANIKFMLAEPELIPTLETAVKARGEANAPNIYVLDTHFDQILPLGYNSWATLLNHGTEWWAYFDDEKQAENTVAQLYFSSGTTGLPKCAMISHHNLVAAHQFVYDAETHNYPISSLICMPMFHVGIMPTAMLAVLREGRQAYVMPRFELESFLRSITDYAITDVMLVPPMVSAVVTSGLLDPRSPNYVASYSLKTLRRVMAGAAPMSAETERRFRALLSPECVWGQVWGMTEMTGIQITARWDEPHLKAQGIRDPSGSVGKPVPGTEMKLVDAAGKDTTEEGVGELCARGPCTFLGYFGNDTATDQIRDAEGFVHTGDIVKMDRKTGLMYVVDRVKDLIKVRGFQVAPAELEAAICELPDVLDAAVVGVRMSTDVEAPRAYVTIRKGVNLTEQQIQEHMRQRVARYKQLTGGIVFVDNVPRSASGKILKTVVRDAAKHEVDHAVKARF